MAVTAVAQLVAGVSVAGSPQMSGGTGANGRPSFNEPAGGTDTTAHDEKPEIAAKKAYSAGLKSLDKAKAYAEQARQAPNADKKTKALDKATDAYYRALDQFTEALSNKGDMVEAWIDAGYVHLHIGAYGEALDDYNHALKLRPDAMDAIESRAEASLRLDRLDDVKSAYMDLYNHARDQADQLMRVMQQWLIDRRADPQGLKSGELDAFAHWVDERLKAAGS